MNDGFNFSLKVEYLVISSTLSLTGIFFLSTTAVGENIHTTFKLIVQILMTAAMIGMSRDFAPLLTFKHGQIIMDGEKELPFTNGVNRRANLI